MQTWTLIVAGLLVWLYPAIVIYHIILKIFWESKDLIKKNKQNKKLLIRESIGEIRFLIPVFNWFLMVNLLHGHHFVETFLKEKFKENKLP